MIDVKLTNDSDPLRFEVRVRHGGSETRHEVTMTRATFDRLAGDATSPQALMEAAFRFLLDREPPNSILQRFDVTVISRYFPEFERALPNYLAPPERR